MKYYITLQYSRKLHLDLLTRSTVASKGRQYTISFVFDSLTDNDCDILIDNLLNENHFYRKTVIPCT